MTAKLMIFLQKYKNIKKKWHDKLTIKFMKFIMMLVLSKGGKYDRSYLGKDNFNVISLS